MLAAALPPQELIYTQWFHADCLADYYHAEAFSEAHWRIVERFATCAAQNGINMLLTPVFTPTLDTLVGGELVRAFGWDTPATGESYQAFLRAFLPALKAHLKSLGMLERTYFHISDEPDPSNMEAYRAARACVLPLLEGCKIIDALSSIEMYREGLAPKPVVASNHIKPFLSEGVPGLWAYYCCGQGVDVSNRFMSMPSHRNRIFGVQLYLYQIEGFLHWGYNFYNSQFSTKHIDPFVDTDAGEGFPSGDAFTVYPGENGEPIPSLRLVVFKEALDDLRALKLLESVRGRDFVETLIRWEAGMDITFSQYPRTADFLYRLRERVNRAIRQEEERA